MKKVSITISWRFNFYEKLPGPNVTDWWQCLPVVKRDRMASIMNFIRKKIIVIDGVAVIFQTFRTKKYLMKFSNLVDGGAESYIYNLPIVTTFFFFK